MERIDSAALTQAISAAFHGVQLGQGVSIRQTEVIDQYGEGFTHAQFTALPQDEVVSDWASIPSGELERTLVAHLDAEGVRYYLPALMLSILDNYDSGAIRVIGTLQELYPKEDRWEYRMRRYGVFSEAQKQAIAAFLIALPRLVELDPVDHKIIERAVRSYWHQFRSAVSGE
jgi:hypothetical protein